MALPIRKDGGSIHPGGGQSIAARKARRKFLRFFPGGFYVSFEKMALRDALRTLPAAHAFSSGLYEFLYGPGARKVRALVRSGRYLATETVARIHLTRAAAIWRICGRATWSIFNRLSGCRVRTNTRNKCRGDRGFRRFSAGSTGGLVLDELQTYTLHVGLRKVRSV